MRNAKRLASLLLALVLVFALAVPAFAAEPTHTYEIYQIFTGDYANGILSNVKWGKNGTENEGDAVSDTILKELEAVTSSTSDTEQLAVITKYANLNSTPVQSDSATKYEGLANGYYLVKDKADTQNSQNGENGFYTLYIVQVVDHTLEFEPKGNVPKSEKKIVETVTTGEGEDATTTDQRVDVNEASIGDTVNYEITGTLPTNIADYNTYYYVFTDTLSKGLTYQNDVKVEVVNGGTATEVTQYFYIGTASVEATGATTITIGIQDLLALKNVQGVTIDASTQIVVTYSATLNENAVIAGEGNPNVVVLDYSNDPNNSGTGAATPPTENPGKPEPSHPTGETPEDKVVTYTTELTILKNDENENILAGAEFTLSGNGVNIVLVTTEKFTVDNTNGTYYLLKNGTYTTTAPNESNSADYASTETKYSKTTTVVAKGNGKTENTVVGTVDPSTGLLTFTGLGAGTYTITETKTPAGYNTIKPITFTLTFNAESKIFVSDNTSVKVGTDNKLDTTIVNQSGATLPSTGGMGTTIFYVLGSVLVLAAVVLLVTKKRMTRG